jgi:hypothetical protein
VSARCRRKRNWPSSSSVLFSASSSPSACSDSSVCSMKKKLKIAMKKGFKKVSLYQISLYCDML